MDDTLETREQLSNAWRAVLDGAVDRGCPAQAAIETMAAVAHERFAALFGTPAAASYLQLLAEQLRMGERQDTLNLIRGAFHEPREAADLGASETDFSIAELLL